LSSERVADPSRSGNAADVNMSLRYFSGTGNTYRVASWIAERARARGGDATLVRIPAGDAAGSPPAVPNGRRVLGILAPTHGFTAPWAALADAATAPGVRAADVFVVVSRAGWYVGPLRLPGLEGTAAWLLALVLVLRGGRLVGVKAIDMPSNWTALHWGMSDEHVATIIRHASARTDAFADSLLDGKVRLTGLVSLAFGVLLAPVSLGYVVLARRLLGKLFFADERCTSCGLCAQHCPVGAVRMAGESPKRPYWTLRCESCMRCMNICPERAIEASWLGAAAQTYVMLLAFEGLVSASAVMAGPAGQTLAATVASAALLVAVLPAYRAFWLLGRPRAAAWFLGHTTPTRLFRRYREPGTDLRDM
jgi:Pyruvate/2-oxoacid:ferredoxin oxidoreductase delta subunit